MVQQVAGVATEPLLVEPGDEAVVAAAEEAVARRRRAADHWRQRASARRASPWPNAPARRRCSYARGLRPGGLAPQESLTRFTWTIAG